MIYSARRPTRSIDYLLATLSPLSVASAVRRYLESQPRETLLGIMKRVTSRLDDDELALFDVPGLTPERFVDLVSRNPRVLGAFDGSDARAILLGAISQHEAIVDGTEVEEDAFDGNTIRATLRAALPPLSPGELVSSASAGIAAFIAMVTTVLMVPIFGIRRAAAAITLGILRALSLLARAFRSFARALTSLTTAIGNVIGNACTVAGAIAPMIARSAAQRLKAIPWESPYVSGVLAACAIGTLIIILLPYLGDMSFVRAGHGALAMRPHPVVRVAAERSAASVSYAKISSKLRAKIPAKLQAKAQPFHPHVAARPHPKVKPHVVVASVPVHPRRAIVKRRAAPAHPRAVALVTIPSKEPQLVQRARLVVSSYLEALMTGDDQAALGNLGLRRSAPTSNLTEASVLQRARAFRIVAAALQNQGKNKTARIDVDIRGPSGNYFGYYLVSANGPAAWITQHEIIPVPR
jgi:hypothetical protein